MALTDNDTSTTRANIAVEGVKILLLVPVLFVLVSLVAAVAGLWEIHANDYLTFGLKNIALQTVTQTVNTSLTNASRLLIPIGFALLLFWVWYRRFVEALIATIGAGALWILLLAGVFYSMQRGIAGVETHNLPDIVRKTLTLEGFFDLQFFQKLEAGRMVRLPLSKPVVFLAALTIGLPFGVVFQRLVRFFGLAPGGFRIGRAGKVVFWLGFIVCLLVTVALNTVTYVVRHRANIPQPNVLLISIDTLRPDAMGAYGAGQGRTPTLDRVAENGALFEQAYSNSPWTLPSHATMLTGLTPTHLGIRKVQDRLSAKTLTLAEVLKNYGYATAAITSYILVSPAYGFAQGFDRFDYTKDMTVSDVVDRAQSFLLQNKTQKFFLFLHIYDPHWPYHPPLETARKFWSAPATPELAGLHNTKDYYDWVVKCIDGPREFVDFSRAMYDAEVHLVDRVLERLFTMLADQAVINRTAIIITSDHGEEFLEHGLMGHGLTLYNESLRVPLIVRFPSVVPPKSRLTMPVQLTDLFPTILSLVGIENPVPYVEGRDLTSEVFLQNQAEPRRYLAETAMSGDPRYAMIEGDFKYLTPVELSFGQDITLQRQAELFDLRQDPGEMRNLSGEQPTLHDHMKSILARELEGIELTRTQSGSAAQGESKSLNSEEIDRLRSLGYIQ